MACGYRFGWARGVVYIRHVGGAYRFARVAFQRGVILLVVVVSFLPCLAKEKKVETGRHAAEKQGERLSVRALTGENYA